jgi:hypothetical protein
MQRLSLLSLFSTMGALIWGTNVQGQTWSVAVCGNGSYNWSTGTCWSGGSAPTSGGSAILANTGAGNIAVAYNNPPLLLSNLDVSGTNAPITLSLMAGSINVNAGALTIDSDAILTNTGNGTQILNNNGATLTNGLTSAANFNNDASAWIYNAGSTTTFFNQTGSTVTNGLHSTAILVNDAGATLWNEGYFSYPNCLISCTSSTVTLSNQNVSFLINGYLSAASLYNDWGAIINNTGSVIVNENGASLLNGVFNAAIINNDQGAIANVGTGTRLGNWNGSTLYNGGINPINSQANYKGAALYNDAGATLDNTDNNTTINNWNGSALINGLNSTATLNNVSGATLQNGICAQGGSNGVAFLLCTMGTLTNQQGSTLNNGSPGLATLINDGGSSLTNTGNGTQLNNQNGSNLVNGNAASGVLNNDAGATLNNTGNGTTLWNQTGATLSNGMTSAATINNGVGATVQNIGSNLFNFNGYLNNSGTLVNLGASTNGIPGSLAQLYNYAGATLNNYGVLNNDAGGMLYNSGSMTNAGTLIVTRRGSVGDGLAGMNTGTFTQTAGYTLIEGTFQQNTLNIQGGTFTQSGAQFFVAGNTQPAGAETYITGNVTQAAGSTVNIGCPSSGCIDGAQNPDCTICQTLVTFYVAGSWTNNGGSINITGTSVPVSGMYPSGFIPNAKLTVTNYTQLSGIMQLNGGALDPAGINIQGGVFGGVGDVVGNVALTNSTLQVGGPVPGSLHIQGNLVQTGGTVIFEINPNGKGGFVGSTLMLDPENTASISNANVVFRFVNGADPMTFYKAGQFLSGVFFKQSDGSSYSAVALNAMLVRDTFHIESDSYRITRFTYDPAHGATSLQASRCRLRNGCL